MTGLSPSHRAGLASEGAGALGTARGGGWVCVPWSPQHPVLGTPHLPTRRLPGSSLGGPSGPPALTPDALPSQASACGHSPGWGSRPAGPPDPLRQSLSQRPLGSTPTWVPRAGIAIHSVPPGPRLSPAHPGRACLKSRAAPREGGSYRPVTLRIRERGLNWGRRGPPVYAFPSACFWATGLAWLSQQVPPPVACGLGTMSGIQFVPSECLLQTSSLTGPGEPGGSGHE